MKKYSLTETQIIKIARLCVQEQGCLEGVKAEASQAANLLETNATYRKKYGSDIYSFMRTSGWYYRAAYYMDNGSASAAAIKAVRQVLCDGKRTLPQYVDEHDCLSDIKSISTGRVTDRSAYIKGKTVIRNKMGSVYTFYTFPAPGCDPFGYTQSAYEYVMQQGGADPDPATAKSTVTVKLRTLHRGDSGDDVMVWQIVVGADPDGIFGERTLDATVNFQTSHGLDGDGVVGAKTWTKGLASL